MPAGQLFLSLNLKTRNHGYNYLHAVKTEVGNFDLVVFTAFQQQENETTSAQEPRAKEKEIKTKEKMKSKDKK